MSGIECRVSSIREASKSLMNEYDIGFERYHIYIYMPNVEELIMRGRRRQLLADEPPVAFTDH